MNIVSEPRIQGNTLFIMMIMIVPTIVIILPTTINSNAAIALILYQVDIIVFGNNYSPFPIKTEPFGPGGFVFKTQYQCWLC